MSNPAPLLNFRQIQPGDRVRWLSLGDESFWPLKSFLQKQALDFHQQNIAKTYVLVEESSSSKVWGYMTLMCSEVTLSDSHLQATLPTTAHSYKTFAAVKIARLAVDKRLQGCGYGTQMVDASICLVKDKIMPVVGCRFLIVEAKLNAIHFYQKEGFTLLNTPQNQHSKHPLMFLDLHKT
jgi:GNAT superfamily N-acetyltransferase